MVSPGMTTRPTDTGMVRMRPAPGASTAPSAACCSMTPRSERKRREIALGDVERGLRLVEHRPWS